MKSMLHTTGYMTSIWLPIFFVLTLLIIVGPSEVRNDFLSFGKLFWFTGLLFVFTNAFGFFYGSPWHREQQNRKNWQSWDQTKTLIVAYVSRGNNEIALRRAITATKVILESTGVKYRNVTDIDMHPMKQLLIWVASGLLMPISCALEGVAVLYSIVAPNKTKFDVVNKN